MAAAPAARCKSWRRESLMVSPLEFQNACNRIPKAPRKASACYAFAESSEFSISVYQYNLLHMSKRPGWELQIGRRLRMRDLHAFLTVTQCGSMAKAAEQPGIAQPA